MTHTHCAVVSLQIELLCDRNTLFFVAGGHCKTEGERNREGERGKGRGREEELKLLTIDGKRMIEGTEREKIERRIDRKKRKEDKLEKRRNDKLEKMKEKEVEERGRKAYPRVVIVTMVYQKAAGILVKVVSVTFFSA